MNPPPPPRPRYLLFIAVSSLRGSLFDGDGDVGFGDDAVVDGAVCRDRQEGRQAFGREPGRWAQGQADAGNTSGPVAGHLELRTDAQTVALVAVAAQVATGVERHAGRERADEQLGRRRRLVGASVAQRLVHAYPVLAHGDLVGFDAEELDIDGRRGGGWHRS